MLFALKEGAALGLAKSELQPRAAFRESGTWVWHSAPTVTDSVTSGRFSTPLSLSFLVRVVGIIIPSSTSCWREWV